MGTKIRPGPDPDFPFLNEYESFDFPVPEEGLHSVIAVGGNLSPGMLLSAYEQGIFPWYSPGDPLLWQSPDPRFVIFRENLHISKSMKKVLRQKEFEIYLDRDFESVINNCACITRPGQPGTWITEDMIEAYTGLHYLGWAHSAESYQSGRLVGGCYGIRLGKVFFGESMFALVPNASKAAFITLASLLFADETAFVDCQTPTDHLGSLGGQEINRDDFLTLLKKTLNERQAPNGVHYENYFLQRDKIDRRGNWNKLYQRTFIECIIQARIAHE